ncbi:MAG: hypothetical protein J6X03_06085, partial [Bacilli bacterium]|nr:hypothetical protein [Bacilli bacterium]
NLPMEEVLIQMIETVSIAEQNEQNQNMDRKLKAFFNDQNNEKYIISVIKEGSEAVAKNQKVNLDDFFRRVSKLKV